MSITLINKSPFCTLSHLKGFFATGWSPTRSFAMQFFVLPSGLAGQTERQSFGTFLFLGTKFCRCFLVCLGYFICVCFFPVNVASFADIFIYTYALKSDMKMHCKVSKSGTVGGKERKLTFSPNRVSTLRVSYGNCKGRCLIGVLTLVCGILLVNFRIKWLLWHVEVPFDCAGSHKVWS